MVSGSDEHAVDAQLVRDLEVVQRIADQQEVVARQPEFLHPGAAERGFAVRVDVVEPQQAGEVSVEFETRDDFTERLVPVGGQHRLGDPRGANGGEGFARPGLQPAFPAAGVVGGDELDADRLETVARKVEAEPLVIIAHREVEERVVTRAIERRQSAGTEQAVHDVDAQVEIVEQRAVPIPDQVTVTGGTHSARIPRRRAGLCNPVFRPRSAIEFAARELLSGRMPIEFPSLAEFGLAPAAEVLTRGFADYLMSIQFSPAILLGMVRQDSVDLAASRVCLVDGAPAGAALIARRGWTCRLAGMAVMPGARRQGVGRKIMALLLAEARARGERAMVLEVIEQNAAAVQLYGGCGFRKVRRLIGAAGPAPAGAEEEIALQEIDPREVARAVDAHGLPDLPWQLSAETLAQLGPPFLAYRGGPSWVGISNPAVSPIGIRAVVTEPAARGQGRAAALVRGVMARHPAKEWRASAIFPEEMTPLFTELGLARTPLSQWQMRRPLD